MSAYKMKRTPSEWTERVMSWIMEDLERIEAGTPIPSLTIPGLYELAGKPVIADLDEGD